jgi:hypothetical protein
LSLCIWLGAFQFQTSLTNIEDVALLLSPQAWPELIGEANLKHFGVRDLSMDQMHKKTAPEKTLSLVFIGVSRLL